MAAPGPSPFGAMSPPGSVAPTAYTHGYGVGGSVVVKKKRGVFGKLLGFVLALLTLALVAALAYGGYVYFFSNDPPPALDAYMHGKGTVYALPHTRISARFPDKPAVETETATLSSGQPISGQTVKVSKDTYEVAIMTIDMPVAVDGPVARQRFALVAGMQAMADRLHIDIHTGNDITVKGLTGIAAHGSWEGDEIEAAMVADGRKVYVLMVHTRRGAHQVIEKLEDSVQVVTHK